MYDVESPVLAEKTDCAGDTLPSQSIAEVKTPLEKALAPLPVPDGAGDTLPLPQSLPRQQLRAFSPLPLSLSIERGESPFPDRRLLRE